MEHTYRIRVRAILDIEADFVDPSTDNVSLCLHHNLKLGGWIVNEADIVATGIKSIGLARRKQGGSE